MHRGMMLKAYSQLPQHSTTHCVKQEHSSFLYLLYSRFTAGVRKGATLFVWWDKEIAFSSLEAKPQNSYHLSHCEMLKPSLLCKDKFSLHSVHSWLPKPNLPDSRSCRQLYLFKGNHSSYTLATEKLNMNSADKTEIINIIGEHNKSSNEPTLNFAVQQLVGFSAHSLPTSRSNWDAMQLQFQLPDVGKKGINWLSGHPAWSLSRQLFALSDMSTDHRSQKSHKD